MQKEIEVGKLGIDTKEVSGYNVGRSDSYGSCLFSSNRQATPIGVFFMNKQDFTMWLLGFFSGTCFGFILVIILIKIL